VTFEKTTTRQPGQADPIAKARKGVHGDWQNYFTRHDAQIFQEHCGHWLHRYGYSSRPDWVQQCPDVLSSPTKP
jgi:hypothetical protein